MQAPVQLEQCVGKDGFQTLAVFMVVVDKEIEQYHDDDGPNGKQGIDFKHHPDRGNKAN